MRDWFVRCAGCGKQYTYNTYKSIRSRFAQDYCPECCAILDEALDKIRQQFVPRWKEIDYLENAPKILNATTEKETSDSTIQFQPVEFVPNGMVSGDVHIVHGVKYAVCKDASGIGHAFAWQEYDLEQEAFGENPWLVEGSDCTYPMTSPKISVADVYPTEIPKPNDSIFFLDYFEKLPDEGYPKDCGYGLWKIWDGVYGNRKFAEEVEKAVVDEVKNTEEPDTSTVSEVVYSNSERFLELLYDEVNYSLCNEKVTSSKTICISFELIGGYIDVEIGEDFIQYNTKFRNGEDFSSGVIPCDFTDLPKELVRVFEKYS